VGCGSVLCRDAAGDAVMLDVALAIIWTVMILMGIPVIALVIAISLDN
jgi:hypothetical protein